MLGHYVKAGYISGQQSRSFRPTGETAQSSACISHQTTSIQVVNISRPNAWWIPYQETWGICLNGLSEAGGRASSRVHHAKTRESSPIAFSIVEPFFHSRHGGGKKKEQLQHIGFIRSNKVLKSKLCTGNWFREMGRTRVLKSWRNTLPSFEYNSRFWMAPVW